MLDTLFFYAFAFLTLAGAIFTVTRRSAVHAAISLVVSLLGVAGLFLLQRAEFLFAVQIVLYIGGIVVLFLFVIMLVNLDEAMRRRQYSHQWLIGLACVILLGVQLVYFLIVGAGAFRLPAATPSLNQDGNVEQLADLLFSEYLLPFELASVLLLVAIVGAVMMAKRRA